MSLRYSLQALLARLPQIDSIQSVEDTRSMLAVMTVTQPRLVVLDVNLLGEDQRSVLALIKAIAPRARTGGVRRSPSNSSRTLQTTSADLVLLKGYPAAELFASIERCWLKIIRMTDR